MGGAVCHYSVLPAEGSRDRFSEAAHATLETRQVLGTGGGGCVTLSSPRSPGCGSALVSSAQQVEGRI